MTELHPYQVLLLEALKDNIDEPLTIRALQDILNVSSPSTVQHHIEQLEKKGYLKRNPYNSRDYQILKTPDQEVVYLNVYGMARCGPRGSVLDGNPVDRMPIASRLLGFPAKDAYLVQAKGDSMQPRINEGDYVIIQHRQVAEHGSTVLCVNDSEVLIKKLVKDGRQIILNSENPKYVPFLPARDFRIEGIVKGILTYT